MIAYQSSKYLPGSQNWMQTSKHPALLLDEVHVWRVSLDIEPSLVERFRKVISIEERARADRFRFEIDRRRFTVARGCLRVLMGRYLKADPAKLSIVYGEYGKPTLQDSVPGTPDLRFNLAHSGGLALYAFTYLGEIGVDVELIRSEVIADDLARRFFSAAEVRCLRQLPKELLSRAFFNGWTRKEALIKAKGKGLSLPLDEFDVTLAPGEPPAVLRTGWDENEAKRWSLRELDAGPGHAAAIALESHNWQLRQWRFEPESGLDDAFMS
jgi:4'-phosphopantetheinyl transferase